MMKVIFHLIVITIIIIFTIINHTYISGLILIIYWFILHNLKSSVQKYNKIYFLEPKFIIILSLIIYNAYFPFIFNFLGYNEINFNLVGGYENFSPKIINESNIMSCIFIVFLFLGVKIFENNNIKIKFFKTNNVLSDNYSKGKFLFFYFLGIISIFVKLLPYFSYRRIFELSEVGVMNLYIHSINFFDTPFLKMLDYFFGNNLFIIAFPTALYYLLNIKTHKLKLLVLNITFFSANFILIFFTYRRLVPILSIIAYISVLIMKKLINHKKKLRFIITTFLIFIVFLFFFSIIRGNILYILNNGINNFISSNQNLINNFLVRNEFSGVNAVTATVVKYRDSFIQGSIFYGLIAPLPLIDKMIYDIVGIENNPSFLWISSIYSEMYSRGGGLSFNPIAESLLIGGILFLIAYSFLIGSMISIFTSKNRNVLYLSFLNVVAFSFARYNFSGFFSQLINIFILFYLYNFICSLFLNYKKK